MFWRRAAGGLSLPTLDFLGSESDNMVKCYLGLGNGRPNEDATSLKRIRGTQKCRIAPELLFCLATRGAASRRAKAAQRAVRRKRCGNDPSAGSPTETLLRLHLPLNVEV